MKKENSGSGEAPHTHPAVASALTLGGWSCTGESGTVHTGKVNDRWTSVDHPGHEVQTNGEKFLYRPPTGETVEGEGAAEIKEMLTAMTSGQSYEAKARGGREFKKFIPFVKIDEKRREVWGVVTAEVPDKDDEVCDYFGSKPYYQAVIDEMSKATDGNNFFPLREMHQLKAAGRCVGFDFRDDDREIYMGFKVEDPDAWNKVTTFVYTGFSQGGQVVKSEPDPVYDGCRRYVADPAEISLVDNPCLASAHFTLVRANGAVELRKFKNISGAGAPAALEVRLNQLAADVALIKSSVNLRRAEDATGGKVRTKRVDGEDLPASSFLIVLNPDKTATWNLPYKFSTSEKTKRHLRNALARFNQLKDVPADVKAKAYKRLVELCQENGIDVAAESKKAAAVHAVLRKSARMAVAKVSREVRGGNVGYALATLDSELAMLRKGMYQVSQLAMLIEQLGWLVYEVVAEQQLENDTETDLPGLLAENVDTVLDTLLRMVEEESTELRTDVGQAVKT